MEGKITRGTFAEYLEIDRSEIDDYLDAEDLWKETMRKLLLLDADVIIDLHFVYCKKYCNYCKYVLLIISSCHLSEADIKKCQ